MRVVPRSLRPLLGAALTLGALSACEWVTPTHRYDPDTPADLQAKALLIGAVAYPSLSGEAPLPPTGIEVELWAEGEEQPRSRTVSDARDGGAFRFEVASGRFSVRAQAPAYASVSAGPLAVAPGDVVDVGTLTLALPAADATLTGRVEMASASSPAGVVIELRRREGQGGCSGTVASTQSDSAGQFFFPALRPGAYVVTARTEGATVDVLPLDLAPGQAHALPRPLTLRPASEVITLEAQGVRPAPTTRSRELVVHIAEFADMTELQLGLDDTFDPARGATGWTAFSSTRAYSLPGAPGAHTVYAQLRSSCATSPRYAAGIVFDDEPPTLLSMQLAGQERSPSELDLSLVPVGDARATLPLSLQVVDLTGVSVLLVTARALPTLPPATPATGAMDLEAIEPTSTQVLPLEPRPGTSLVRADIDLPPDEGLYALHVRLQDRAGNETGASTIPPIFVSRDFSPPSTPVPLVERLEVQGPRALLWLKERPCGIGQDETMALVCESNPHPEAPFLVRGGPAFLDFTPAMGPPFVVPLFEEGSTTVEIVAQDAGGNRSSGVARVEVNRPGVRRLYTAPRDVELGVQRLPRVVSSSDVRPPLDLALSGEPLPFAATGANAFFSLRPRAGVEGRLFSYLVSQPLDRGDVGLDPSATSTPNSIRKLNMACEGGCDVSFDRVAGALGAGAGAQSWLERISIFASSPRPYRHVVFADADGRFDLAGPEFRAATGVDFEGERAPRAFLSDRCEEAGQVRCAPDLSTWAPYHQEAPRQTAMDGRHVVSAASATRFEGHGGVWAGTLEVVGPMIVANVYDPLPGLGAYGTPLITGFAVDIDVPVGTVLYSAAFAQPWFGDEEWRPVLVNDQALVAVHVAEGGGREVFTLPEPFNVAEPMVLGVWVPEGTPARLGLWQPTAKTAAETSRWQANGILRRELTPGACRPHCLRVG